MPEEPVAVNARRMRSAQKQLVCYCKGEYRGEWQADLVTVPALVQQKNEVRHWQQPAAGTI